MACMAASRGTPAFTMVEYLGEEGGVGDDKNSTSGADIIARKRKMFVVGAEGCGGVNSG